MKRKSHIFSALAALALACSLSLTALAAGGTVTTVDEAHASADTIYVSGAPDLYPIEFYDEESGNYLGILPQALARVAEETGISFTYLRSGPEDQRARMAKNNQVELVSGLTREEAADLSLTPSAFTLSAQLEGESVELCFGFTALADAGLVSAVNGALSAITAEEIAAFTISAARERASLPYPLWLPFVGFGLALFFLLLAVYFARRGKRNKEEEQHMVQTDPVTGIGNWKYFAAHFEMISPQARPVYSVTYFGFDGARVQDSGSEQLLDDTMIYAAKELTRTGMDNDIIARAGYGFLVAHVCVGRDRIAQWVQGQLELLNGPENPSRALFRAGIYLLSTDDRDAETALFNARQAYLKAAQESQSLLFSSDKLLQDVNHRRQVVSQFHTALEKKEIKLYLQFTVNAADKRILGAEGLARWDHPQRGLLHPGHFVEYLKDDGSIPLLDLYIFEAVCQRLEQWQKQGIRRYISCNFTLLTLEVGDLPEKISAILSRYAFDRGCLVIEITEDLRDDREAPVKITKRNLAFLKEQGISIALDDVGNGFSSFSDLRDYPIDLFKIDRSILLNASSSERGVRLMQGMSALAHSLQLSVLCEGVETQEQVDLAIAAGCDQIQGYFFYRPMPADEATRLLLAKR